MFCLGSHCIFFHYVIRFPGAGINCAGTVSRTRKCFVSVYECVNKNVVDGLVLSVINSYYMYM